MYIKEAQYLTSASLPRDTGVRQWVPGNWLERLFGGIFQIFWDQQSFICVTQVWRGHIYFRDKQCRQVKKSGQSFHLGSHLLQPRSSHCAGHCGRKIQLFVLEIENTQFTGYRREGVKPNTSCLKAVCLSIIISIVIAIAWQGNIDFGVFLFVHCHLHCDENLQC